MKVDSLRRPWPTDGGGRNKKARTRSLRGPRAATVVGHLHPSMLDAVNDRRST